MELRRLGNCSRIPSFVPSVDDEDYKFIDRMNQVQCDRLNQIQCALSNWPTFGNIAYCSSSMNTGEQFSSFLGFSSGFIVGEKQKQQQHTKIP